MKFQTTILLLFLSSAFKTQSLSGVLTDSINAPVSFVPVALLGYADSSIVKGTNTNEEGKYSFENLKPGKYLVKVETVGFNAKISSVYEVDSLLKTEVDKLVLNSSAVNLNEVSVTVQKKLVEFKNGNITVNVENSPLAVGNSLYELLQRLPTVTIIDDIISIQGKSGTRILIDERLQQMEGQQLINLLKSIRASTVEKIEILKNPPVKYDAAGSGFISVKTKKLKITGFSGSANLDYQQGFYSNKNGGLSLNYKGKNFAVFSNINTGNNESQYRSFFKKRITYEGITTDFNQTTTEKSSHLFASYTIGADWYLSKNNTVGFRVEGSNGQGLHYRTGVNDLTDGELGYNQLAFVNNRPNAWNYINYNLNAEHLFDTLGTILRFSCDYSPNQDLNSGDFYNYFLDQTGVEKQAPRIFKSDNNLQFIIYSAKLDFEKNLSKTLKLEAGVKGNDQGMTTNFNFNNKDPITGEYSLDTLYTNGFRYKEQIYAGYFNLSKEFKKFSAQLGVRGENTSIKASSTSNNVTYVRNYFNLFPMLSLNYNPSEKHSYQLSYNRRINRPNYANFNPYKYYVNLFVSVQGNPYLVPEYSHNLEFTHGFKSSIYNTIYFSHVNNIFYGYPLQNDSTKETLQKTANLSECNNYGYSLFVQKELTKWWMFSLSGNASYLTFAGQVEGNDYSGISIQSSVYLNNQLSLPKSFKLELDVFYVAPTNVVIYKNKSTWNMNFALRKSFLKDKLTAVIGMNDVFYTWVTRNDIRYLNINSDFRATYDTRRFKASLSYAFGKVKVQQRQTKSNQDEKKRLDH